MPLDTGANAALSVREAVLLGRVQRRRLTVGSQDLTEVGYALDFFGISALNNRDIGDLSSAQNQFVSGAQAIVQEPEILLLDEPTSALEVHRQISFLAILRHLAKQRGVLVMAKLRDLGHVFRFTDQTMVLRGGALVACGPAAQVVTLDLLRKVWGIHTCIGPCRRGHRQIIVGGVTRIARPIAALVTSSLLKIETCPARLCRGRRRHRRSLRRLPAGLGRHGLRPGRERSHRRGAVAPHGRCVSSTA